MEALRGQLAAAEADVARLAEEREKLMEISNMLRADLNRAMADGASPAASRDAAEAAAERATREVGGPVEAAGESERVVGQGKEVCEQVGAQYEAKLGEIEGAMRELISQNRALKARCSREAAERQPRVNAKIARTVAVRHGDGNDGNTVCR